MKYYIILFITLLTIASCTGTKPTLKNTGAITKLNSNEKVKINIPDKPRFLTLKGKLTVDADGQKNSGTYRLLVAGKDSLSMTIYGPFGILVGKLYADKDYYLFYNSINDEAFDGKPTTVGFEKAIQIPLSFANIIRFIRCKLQNENAEFKILNVDEKNDSTSLLNTNEDFEEKAIVNNDLNKLLTYNFRNKKSKISYEVKFEDYKLFGKVEYSKTIKFSFKQNNTEATLEIESIDAKETNSTPYKFKTDGIVIKRLND